jgi:plastocyanin
MAIKLFAVALAIVGITLVACGGRGGGSSIVPNRITTYTLPGMGSDLVMTAKLPKHTIGEELPLEGVGSIHSNKWKAELGGFTQEERSQSLAFPPGTKITIRNLSESIAHTLDVVKEVSGPPAKFPKNPNLSIPAKGHGKLEAGYASGNIKWGKSVTVTLAKEGIYLIGCAYHYSEGMHDVLVVKKEARPGPQATPSPKTTSPPTSRSSYAPSEP